MGLYKASSLLKGLQDIHFWSTKKLEYDFTVGGLSQRQRYKYFLVYIVAGLIVSELDSLFSMFKSETAIPLEMSLISTISIVAAILGTVYCYHVNQKGDDKGFIDRYICFSIPIGVRVCVIFFIISRFYVYGCDTFLRPYYSRYYSLYVFDEVVFALGYSLVFYWMLSSSIRRVASVNLYRERAGTDAYELSEEQDV